MIRQKKVVKELIHFAIREFKEKGPLLVQVLRMKGEKFLTKGGPFKVLSISKVSDIYYMILINYMDNIRLYYFSKEGLLLGAENLGLNEKLIKEIKKSSVLEFEYPK